MTVASAPGKVIITGEHFVVHGQPALAAAVNLYSRATVEEGPRGILQISSPALGARSVFSIKSGGLSDERSSQIRPLEPLKLVVEKVLEKVGQLEFGLRLDLTSQIPVGVGLGSSASTAVSTAAAVARFLNLRLEKSEIYELASVQERFIHKKPSGIDATTATYGGVILFKIGRPPTRMPAHNQISMVVGNTGTRRSTGDLVTKVTRRVEVGDHDLARTSDSAGELTLKAAKAYEKQDFHQLGLLMNENHELLKKIGVSTAKLDRLVKAAQNAGALGAKLTGAGGGGCMIALSELKNTARVADSIAKAQGRPYIVSIDEAGVSIEGC